MVVCLSRAYDLGVKLQYPYRLRPYCSWLETQSDEAMADVNEISPANATPAMISANLYAAIGEAVKSV